MFKLLQASVKNFVDQIYKEVAPSRYEFVKRTEFKATRKKYAL